MKEAVIVQARLGSRRFPRKILAELNRMSVLAHVLERCEQIGPPVILATPNPELCAPWIRSFVGSEDDVLERYLLAANAYSVEVIMRITADCPLIQPNLCRDVLALYYDSGADYAAIGWPMTYPKGYGCEVFGRRVLEAANKHATDQCDREHVTPWIERTANCVYLTQDKDESHLNYCVDEPGDIERLEKIMAENKTAT